MAFSQSGPDALCTFSPPAVEKSNMFLKGYPNLACLSDYINDKNFVFIFSCLEESGSELLFSSVNILETYFQ